MIIQIDSEKKIIKVQDKIKLSELYRLVTNWFEDWEDWTLETNVTIKGEIKVIEKEIWKNRDWNPLIPTYPTYPNYPIYCGTPTVDVQPTYTTLINNLKLEE